MQRYLTTTITNSPRHLRIQATNMSPVLAKHIDFDFTLLDSNEIPRQPNGDEHKKVLHALPHNKDFKVIGPFLIVHVNKLPSKPWPVSVAGIALFLTTNQFELPWKLGLAGDPRFKILSNRDCRASSTREDYDTVVSYFVRQDIYVHQIVWISGIWRLQIGYREGLKLPG